MLVNEGSHVIEYIWPLEPFPHKVAIKLTLDFIRTRSCGEAVYCGLFYNRENDVAGKTNRSPEDWDEISAALKL